FEPKNYLHVLRALQGAWDGLLALCYFALVVGAFIAAVVIFVGARYHVTWLPNLSAQVRGGVMNTWWVTAFIPLGTIFGVYVACDTWLWAFGRARPFGAASFTRGFEPLEQLAREIIRGERPQAERLTALFVLAPLLLLAVPAAVFLVLHD